MLWHGGSSYNPGTVPGDVEEFDTCQDAQEAFTMRPGQYGYPGVSQEVPDDGGPTAWVWFSRPPVQPDPYPDEVWAFGPRKGLVRQPA